MPNIKCGSIVARKAEIGESDMIAYVVQKQKGDLYSISPINKLRYSDEEHRYVAYFEEDAEDTCSEQHQEVIVHRKEIASIYVLNTEITDIFLTIHAMEEERGKSKAV